MTAILTAIFPCQCNEIDIKVKLKKLEMSFIWHLTKLEQGKKNYSFGLSLKMRTPQPQSKSVVSNEKTVFKTFSCFLGGLGGNLIRR